MVRQSYHTIPPPKTGAASFSPSSPLSFPSQLVGSESSPETVQLTNTGAHPISISSVEASGNFRVSNSCGKSVPSGGSCTISAVFAPRSQGRHTGAVTLVDSASSKPQVIELSGTTTFVELTPESLEFGRHKVGTQSEPLTVVAKNEGKAAVTFSSLAISGTDGADFSETNDCLSGAIAPGGECSVSVTFTPGKSGPRTATLHLDLRGGFSPRPVTLAGDGD
jgi:Abnormal spindle-like microcephaly-assoc'd, ASPM-SPD-2-Hydin